MEQYKGSKRFFYTDDGLFENEDEVVLQNKLNNIIALLDTLAFKANETKTTFMVFRGPVTLTAISTEAYHRECTKEGKTFNAKVKETVSCSICGKEMKWESLQRPIL